LKKTRSVLEQKSIGQCRGFSNWVKNGLLRNLSYSRCVAPAGKGSAPQHLQKVTSIISFFCCFSSQLSLPCLHRLFCCSPKHIFAWKFDKCCLHLSDL